MLGDRPFVLFDDARADGAAPARLYADPQRIIEAHTSDDVAPALAELRAAVLEGHAVAGYLAYEAGHALEPKLQERPIEAPAPLLWFGVFSGYQDLAPEWLADLLPDPAGGWLGQPKPLIARTAYDAALAKVQAYIAAGDIYQANFTIRADVPIMGHPLAAYAGLRARAAAGYGGVIWTGERWLLSLSPELFFAVKDRRITAKPMKGTARRGPDDAAAIAALRADPKQRAENLMIVDLIRNDLSRVAKPGSVAVPELFGVETYPTIHQMISTVTATLPPDRDAIDILETTFPCGSITGAPKIRAMDIIGQVESGPRGIYTGSIGRIDANGDAAFNVAIRTLEFVPGEGKARLGLGGGIVADSVAASEWDECLAKGGFVADPRPIDLIETMRFDPEGGIHLLDRHVARIGKSARAFGIAFDRHAVRNELQAATFRIAAPRKVRLMLSQSGRIAIEIGRLPPIPTEVVTVALAAMRGHPDDFRLHHKTSDRSSYPVVKGAFETISVDAAGYVTEGSFTSVFVKGDGVLITPPLSCGILPGILREELIANGSAIEANIRVDTLVDGFFIGNAVRGLLPAKLQPV
jgi:para-aminobenzoate synthetase / 4-amino-4-deoxychorismate lyase